MEVDEGSDQKSDIWSHWKAAHARLKNEFTEDEKYHNLMRWLICQTIYASLILQNSHCFVKVCTPYYNFLTCYKPFEPWHDKTNKMACTASEDSDQPRHPLSLIKVFAVRMKKACVLSYPWAHSEDAVIGVFAGRTIILLVLSWGGSIFSSEPRYWQPRSDRIFSIDKSCDTREHCEAEQRGLGLRCMRNHYRDWWCTECCQGDRCNYYVTVINI